MKKIKISKSGIYALVDDEDYEWLNDLRWRLAGNKHKIYALHSATGTIYMHQLVLLAKNNFIEPEKRLYSDHINGNSLDNRQSNLRYVTPQQNTWNRKQKKLNINSIFYSKYIGVHKERGSKFITTVCGKYIGSFYNEKEAAMAYDREILKQRGKYATLNFPNLSTERYCKKLKTVYSLK